MTDPDDTDRFLFHIAADPGEPPELTPADLAEGDQWMAESRKLARRLTDLVISGDLAAEAGRKKEAYALAGYVRDLVLTWDAETAFGVIINLATNLGHHLMGDDKPQLVEAIRVAYDSGNAALGPILNRNPGKGDNDDTR